MNRAPRTILLLAALLSSPLAATAQETTYSQGRVVTAPGHVLTQRQRIEPVNRMLAERLEVLLPELMRETGIDMWLVLNREYAEDPVFFTLAPEPVFAARRTTMLVFHDRGPEEGVDRLTVSRYPFGDSYEPAWRAGSRRAMAGAR